MTFKSRLVSFTVASKGHVPVKLSGGAVKNMGNKSKPKNTPHSALDVLQGMLEKGNSPLAQDFKRYRLKLDWAKVVGATIGDKCSPIGYTNGILYVWVVNATWMNQLFYVRRELSKKINQYMQTDWVKEIRFTQNRRDVPADGQWTEDQPDGRGSGSPNGDGEPPRDP
jgi:hypothetical protein